MSLTPKAIAKKIKAKGLQKLRWYCQMCEKQCRDANGFKCHKTSEKHLQMMKLAAANKGTIFERNSKEFEKAFMDIVKRRCRSKAVLANKIYNEYISDRNHLRMNATRFETLTGFITYLGKSGKVVVDETEKGLRVKYIDKDPETLARLADAAKKEKMAVDDETRDKRRVKAMIKAAAAAGTSDLQEATELKKDPDQSIQFALAPSAPLAAASTTTTTTTTTTTAFSATPSVKVSVSTNIFETLAMGKDKKRDRSEDDDVEEDDRDKKRVKTSHSVSPSRTDSHSHNDRDKYSDFRRDGERERHRYDDRRDRDHDERGKDREYKAREDRDRRDYRDRDHRDNRNSRDNRDYREDRDRDREGDRYRNRNGDGGGRSRYDERDSKGRDNSRTALDEIYENIRKKKEQEAREQEKKEREMEEKRQEEEKRKKEEEANGITENWLYPGIVVKVVNKKLGGGTFYGRKGKVTKLVDEFIGIVKMLDGGEEMIKIDQADLETVIPGIGLTVLIVNGESKGKNGTLEGIDVDNFKAFVVVNGKKIEKDYEHISKFVGI